jgi:autotransporter translocation and assembly factor TamB
VKASHVFLDTLELLFAAPPEDAAVPPQPQPARYGGVIDLTAMLSGTRDDPHVSADLTVSNGRVERVSYDRLAGHVAYAQRKFDVDLTLDQSPGVQVTAVGAIPLAYFRDSEPEQPVDLALKSTDAIDLRLLAGLTDVIHDVSGKLFVDVRAIGTNRDPHFAGKVRIEDAGFAVTATGAAYKNSRLEVTFSRDLVTFDSLHVVDASGRTLDATGSLATHELRVGNLEMTATARRFELIRNEFGRIMADANLRVGGTWEQPRLSGDLSITAGEVRVDEVLQRSLSRPYATEPTTIVNALDAVAALNPWDRLAVGLFLHVANPLRLSGKDIPVTQSTGGGSTIVNLIGVSDINLRVSGDLYLYKDPGQVLYVTGSLDRVEGTYGFQGRRFDVDPTSSIIFKGDWNPEVYVGVTRLISGVQARVGIYGQLPNAELRLSSSPPLDESDILSLIVFNQSTNQLTSGQQQELLVRAGTLAAGFVAKPLVTAIENETGIDVLEIDPSGEFGGGPRLTIGEEIAPGLVARFSRQFGSEPYDEATIEYALSRILRLRATFSDAQSLSARSPFRRLERAGVDLLLFFSF